MAQRRRKREADTETLSRESSVRRRASAFSDLHSDILTIVFSFIPIDPRLKVVARVCKHWHAAVLRSVTFVPLRWAGLRSPLPLLPSVTGLELDSEWLARRTYRTHLLTLGIRSRGWSFQYEFIDSRFLRSNCKSLTSLSVSFESNALLPHTIQWPELPSLVCLQIAFWLHWSPLAALLKALASQLRELLLFCPPDIAIDSTLQFPELDRLVLKGSAAKALTHFLTHAPLLKELYTTIYDDRLWQLSPDECTRITALTLHCPYSSRANSVQTVKSLAQCTRLTSLKLVEGSRKAQEDIITPHLTRLRHLTANAFTSHRLERVLRTATNLTSLGLADMTALPPKACALPSLRELCYTSTGESEADVTELQQILAFLSSALPLFPKLDTLRLELLGCLAFGSEGFEKLRELLAQAERHGLSTVHVLGFVGSPESAAELRRGLTWLRVELEA